MSIMLHTFVVVLILKVQLLKKKNRYLTDIPPRKPRDIPNLVKESNLKIKEKMQLRKIIQQDISNKTGFEYELAMEMKRDAARQLGYHINDLAWLAYADCSHQIWSACANMLNGDMNYR
ncbi:hypothetical protein LXL04_015952 [Taraxacum kok-saghyz]